MSLRAEPATDTHLTRSGCQPRKARRPRPLLADVREQADAIRAEAERQAAQIIRDAEERADLLLKARLAYAERELDRLRLRRKHRRPARVERLCAARLSTCCQTIAPGAAEESRSWMQDHVILRAFAGRHAAR